MNFRGDNYPIGCFLSFILFIFNTTCMFALHYSICRGFYKNFFLWFVF